MTWSEYMKNENGYETITTFWDDFSIADKFGIDAIKDTFKRAFEEWKTSYKYVTELVIVLNHKIYEHMNSNMNIAYLYNELYDQANDWCWENLKGEELDYFYHTTN